VLYTTFMNQLLSEEETEFVREAHQYFENPSFLMKVSQTLGKPIERTLNHLPDRVQVALSEASQKALNSALQVSLLSLQPENQAAGMKKVLEKIPSSQKAHRIATAVTGIAGGFFGIPALPIELPMTTILMLRSIAKTAQENGFNLSDRQTQLECLYVFSMGKPVEGDSRDPDDSSTGSNTGEGPGDQASSSSKRHPVPVKDTHYYSARMAFATMARDVLEAFASRSAKEIADLVTQGSIPVLTRLLSRIAAKFQLVVTDKVIAQTVPILGAAAGGALNFIFTEHFNTVAKYHFGMRALERKYGQKDLQKVYSELHV
jgi:hypothetical protein